MSSASTALPVADEADVSDGAPLLGEHRAAVADSEGKLEHEAMGAATTDGAIAALALAPPAAWTPSLTILVGICMFSFGCRTWLPIAIGLSKTGSDMLYSVAFVIAMAESIKFTMCAIALPIQYV